MENEPLGEGLDHRAYLTGDGLVVRSPVGGDSAQRAAAVEREARLLAAVAELSPLPVPRVAFVDPAEGRLGYELLPGVPLLVLPEDVRAAHAGAVAARLGELLRALHAVPRERVAALAEVDALGMEAWLDEARDHYARARDPIPPAHRPAVEAFLAEAPPPAVTDLVFSHNDLGIEHVLVDPDSLTVTGVIDWSDAALVDPAGDFGLLLRDLGPAGLESALAAYAPRQDEAPGLRARALFYARCALFEDLVFGLETGRAEYADKSVAGVEWLFPAS